MQNYGKVGPMSCGKIEQNYANVAFADDLLQICYRGKSVFSSSGEIILDLSLTVAIHVE